MVKIDKNKINIKKIKANMVIFIFAFFITFLFVIQIKAVAELKIGSNIKLDKKSKNNYIEIKNEHKILLNKIKEKTDKIEELKNKVKYNNNFSDENQKEIENLNKILGLTNISGEGIEIQLEDNISTNDKNNIFNLIHDNDLIDIINILRNAGAESIAVNDERITYNSKIECIGTIVKINNKKIGSPFKITAIGNTKNLKSALLLPGGIVDSFKIYNINVKIEEKNITQLKYEGLYE